MIKKILLVIFANIVFVIAVITIYAVGYEYDKAHRIYPEMKWLSYDLVMQVYGQRWERIAKILFALGVIVDVVIVLIWYRKQQSKQSYILDLHTNI